MPYFKNFNHKNRFTAFAFNAVFAALSFAIILVYDDWLENYLKRTIKKKKFKHYIKLIVHSINIFFFSLLLTYILYWLFGWGNSLIG